MDRRIEKTIAFLDDALRAPGAVSEIAARVGLSASRLEHLFKGHVRLSIRAYVHERRLRRAAELLVNTDERISQICYAVGFGDPSNFNHAFKKNFGLTPKEYRRATNPTNE
ncbi:MAG: AraC family transcriptional regulator, arabinose operon regulatory protein [Thermoanaerobaculia bacterium]|jgi:AraC family transcriptional regulator of arabinose operon|nr:AraC family transcriptional regulator, arabinose operon regulatory protein [Thermoanaerobaculia bacterium]